MEANMVGSQMYKVMARIWAVQKGEKVFKNLSFLIGRTGTERTKGGN